MALATLALFAGLMSAPAHVPVEEPLVVGEAAWWIHALSEGPLTPEVLRVWLEHRRQHDETRAIIPRRAGGGGESTGRGMGSNVEQWRGLVSAHFPSEAVDRMMCLMKHESGGNPGAKNPRSSARGLFQILGSLWAPHFGVAPDDLYDPELNVLLARRIWDRQGYGAWSPWNRGLCR